MAQNSLDWLTKQRYKCAESCTICSSHARWSVRKLHCYSACIWRRRRNQSSKRCNFKILKVPNINMDNI